MGTFAERGIGRPLHTSSNGTHHRNQNQNPIEQSAIVEHFQNLEIQSNVEEDEGKTPNYPFRPNVTDCAFFLRTGTCKYGINCRFNHPAKRVFKAVGEKEQGTVELNEMACDIKRIECKYFSTPGGCKYGDACRYDHPSEEIEMNNPELNFVGLPIRPMEKECMFYMRTSLCAYGANCRFNHPNPTAVDDPPRNSLANGYSSRVDNNLPKTNGPMHSSGVNSSNSAPYASNMNSYHQGKPRNPGWNQNQVTASLPPNKPSLPHQIVDLSKKRDPSANYERLMQIEEFPERPGQPDCDYFVRTGDCKYRSSCKFNHPISRSSRLPLPAFSSKPKDLYSRSAAKVSPVETTEFHNPYPGNASENEMRYGNHQKMQNGGFPERPGEAECEYYMKTGSCKFNSACRFHHPRNRVPASSSPCALSQNGLPLRPGARICRNYEEHGTCQYGIRCLFDHPDNVSLTAVEDNCDFPSTFDTPVSDNHESDWNDGWVI